VLEVLLSRYSLVRPKRVPQWVWWVAHRALGTTIGLVYLRLERRPAAIAMPQGAQALDEPPVEKAA
jgi:hypothetical protein